MRALKEWSAAVHALLAGRQALLLRKGGIHEKRFAVPEVGDNGPTTPFLLFPTVSHAHRERVRPEHRDLLAPAARDVTEDEIVVRAAAGLVAAIEVRRPERIDELEPWHLWTGALPCGPTDWTSGPSTGWPRSSCRSARSARFGSRAGPSTAAAAAGSSCPSSTRADLPCDARHVVGGRRPGAHGDRLNRTRRLRRVTG